MASFDRYLAYHHGVFSRAEARSFGLSDAMIQRRLADGRWVREAPRVFRLASAPDSWMARARTAALSTNGLVSHTSALRLWQIDGHSRRRLVHVLVAGSARRSIRPLARVHRVGELPIAGATIISGVPVTGVARSVIDSAAVLGVDDLDCTIDAVVRQGHTSVQQLRSDLADLGSQGRRGLGELRRLLDMREPGDAPPDSGFNRRVGRLLVTAGLPEPRYEYEVEHGGRFVGRADLAYPGARLLIECDSARWHRNRRSFHEDPRRRNRLSAAGFQVLSFTWDDFANRPHDLISTVAAALRGR